MNEWMNYFPDFMSLWGMLLYSLIAYIIISIHSITKRRTVENYV